MSLYTKDTLMMKVLENSHDAMFIAEGEKFLDANEAALKMFGVSSAKAFIKMHAAAVSPEFQEDGQSSYLKANEMVKIALEKGFHRFEWLHQTIDEVPLEVEVTLIIFKDGERNLSFVQIRKLSDIRENYCAKE